MEKMPKYGKKRFSNFETEKSFSVETILAYDWMRPNWMIRRRDELQFCNFSSGKTSPRFNSFR